MMTHTPQYRSCSIDHEVLTSWKPAGYAGDSERARSQAQFLGKRCIAEMSTSSGGMCEYKRSGSLWRTVRETVARRVLNYTTWCKREGLQNRPTC